MSELIPEEEPFTDELNDFSQFDDEDNTNDDYDIEHPEEVQNRDILNSEEAEHSEAITNEAIFLDRNKIILVITIVVFVVLILFLCMPSKRKVKKNNELEKAGTVYIPSEIDRWTVETNENTTSAGQPKEEVNSSKEISKKDLTLPGIDEPKKAPVEVPQKISQSSGNDFPVTNRNEQQKAFHSVELDSGGIFNVKTNNASSTTSINNKYTSKNVYTPNSLQNNVSAYLANQSTTSYDKQNNQTGKQNFLEKNRGTAGAYQWNSDFSLWKGTVISAVLDTGINTNLPGEVIATVTENIYSSNNGNYILIPQGSRLYADYNSSISYGQNRVQVVWNTLIRPDGLEVSLGSTNGVDKYGYSGYAGKVNSHPFEYAKALGLIAMFSILDTKANNTIETQDNMYAQNALSEAYSTSKRITEKIIDRALDIQPTITIPAGEEIKLITNITMELPPLDPIPVEEKYRREN